jgi:iron complex transport system substrate-binding protein
MWLNRRSVVGGSLAALAMPRAALAASVTDSAGRALDIPDQVTRVFPAGPPAAIMLYTLAPDLMLGWPRANRAEEMEFLLPEAAAKPEIGRLTGRGGSANLENVLRLKPDLIVDTGTTGATYVSLAETVQAQTGIPYALLDGRFPSIPESYRTFGRLLRREDRAEELASYAATLIDDVRTRVATIPSEKRPRVYFARGPDGLNTGLGGSINVETIEFVGAVNVAAERQGGLAAVSIEQVLAWNPDIIVTIDLGFAAEAGQSPLWRHLRAVKERRVHLAPSLPFGWIDFPPSVNRLIGLRWLAGIFYPEAFPEDIVPLAREFYRVFYHVEPGEEQIRHVLGPAGMK